MGHLRGGNQRRLAVRFTPVTQNSTGLAASNPTEGVTFSAVPAPSDQSPLLLRAHLPDSQTMRPRLPFLPGSPGMLIETVRIMECAERERLWEEYRRAVNAFSISTRSLDTPLTYSEFALRVNDIEAAEARWKAARKAWEDHAGGHRCGRRASVTRTTLHAVRMS